MWDLFSTNSDTAGFRLQYMELLNWGTFHKEIVRISPAGNNTLLTGVNGSGKSTYIDALLTLLVPQQRMRFYNQSSGVEKRGDRTEESYVLGHYGNILKEGATNTTVQKFREKQNTYSILLASFSSTIQQTITLFQVRWFYNNELKKCYGIATHPLEIAKDFPKFDSRGDWKKLLEAKYNYDKSKRKKIEFFNTYKEYEAQMIDHFGMLSNKALSLFNQMVGVKVLEDLNEFISTHMLKETDAQKEYEELKKGFFLLTEAYDNIKKAKLQVELLKPLCAHIQKLQQAIDKAKELQQLQEESIYGFANQYVILAQEEIIKRTSELKQTREYIASLKEEREQLNTKRIDLERDIRNDAVGIQIESLKKERKENNILKEERTQNVAEYNEIITSLALIPNPDQETFEENREKAKFLSKEALNEEQVQDDNYRKLSNENEKITQQMDFLQESIEILRKNKNNISGREATIRDEILVAVGATKEEIPFIGELIKVRGEEGVWEYAIEKVLHHTALHLVVPFKFYSKVNAYVNSHNLKGRIRYYKYEEVPPKIFQQSKQEPHLLINKIEIKPKHPYFQWIEQLIESQHNFTCVEELSDFEQFTEMALTPKGLIKYRKGKHEKDDREVSFKRSNYVLGWENEEKIKELNKEYKLLKELKERNEINLKGLQAKRSHLREKQIIINKLNEKYSKYDKINWQTYALKIQQLDIDIERLEQTNNRMKVLEEQFSELKRIIDNHQKRLDEENRKEFTIEQIIGNITKKKQENQQLLDENPEKKPLLFTQQYPDLSTLSYATIENKRQEFQNQVREQINDNKDFIHNEEKEITMAITKLKHPEVQEVQKFKNWDSDLRTLPEKIDPILLNEYQQFLDRIEKDNLPKYEKKFQDYLHETTIHQMGKFAAFFDNTIEEIQANIRQLNESLKKINFNSQPETYIQLAYFPRQNNDIISFKDFLRRAHANINEISKQPEGRKLHFEEHIVPFMEQLEQEKWRKEVLDVRRWLNYKAEEFVRETNTKTNTYEYMGALSGGEKAQLTYTILGSALAYQYGILKDGLQGKSFRFVAVDEAFKSLDKKKAYYLITLCKQLHLQLLAVTPCDGTHIVEDDIAYVHYIFREDKNKPSHLINMSIEQFKDTYKQIKKS